MLEQELRKNGIALPDLSNLKSFTSANFDVSKIQLSTGEVGGGSTSDEDGRFNGSAPGSASKTGQLVSGQQQLDLLEYNAVRDLKKNYESAM